MYTELANSVAKLAKENELVRKENKRLGDIVVSLDDKVQKLEHRLEQE